MAYPLFFTGIVIKRRIGVTRKKCLSMKELDEECCGAAVVPSMCRCKTRVRVCMPMNRLRRSQGRMRERADWRNIIGEFEEEGVPGVLFLVRCRRRRRGGSWSQGPLFAFQLSKGKDLNNPFYSSSAPPPAL